MDLIWQGKRILTPNGSLHLTINPPEPPVVSSEFKVEINTTSSNQQIQIPHLNGYNYNYTVDYGDNSPIGTVTTYNGSDTIHTYSTPGVYVIKISGLCETFYVDGAGTMKNTIKRIISWGNTGFRRINLGGSPNLTSVVTDNLGAFSLVTDFTNMFSVCSSLSSIPSGLFDYAINAENFYGAFQHTPISTIPSGLFNNCPNVTSFDGTFLGCASLTSIPSTLFNYNTMVDTFSSVFAECTGLLSIPSTLFDNCTNVTIFSYAFGYCTSLTGNAPELWLTHSSADGYLCFSNDTSLDNYTLIPETWGGPASPHIELTTINPGLFIMTLYGDDTDSLIDWGDGERETYTISSEGVEITHDYSSTSESGGLVKISNANILVNFEAGEQYITSVTIPIECVNLSTIYLDSNQLTSISIPQECTNLSSIDISNNSLTTFTVYSDWTNLTQLNLLNNDIVVDDVNSILETLYNMGMSSGTINLSGGTNGGPIGIGLTSKYGLINDYGITVLTNDAPSVIYLSFEPNGSVETGIYGIGMATVDMGDGSEPQVFDLSNGLESEFYYYDGLPHTMTISNVAGMTSMSLYTYGATSCTIPSNCLDLTSIYLGECNLDSFTIPSELVNLNDITLNNNNLTSIDIPSTLVNLNQLELSYNQLSSVTLPPELTNLTYLNLDYNNLTTLSIPVELTQLNALYVSNNSLTSLEIPVELTNLTDITANNNNIASFIIPEESSSLQRISLSSNNLTSLEIPTTLTSLSYLYVSRNLLTALDIPNICPLRELEADNNLIMSITIAPEWTNLSKLSLNKNLLSTIEIPSTLNKIQKLSLQDNSLTEFIAYPTWQGAKYIYLQNNQLSSFTAYENWNLFQLYELNLRNNLLESVDIPTGLTYLQNLNLGENLLTEFTVPTDWKNRNSINLHLDNNNISDDTAINNILLGFSGGTYYSGSIYLNDGTNAEPTGIGITAMNYLKTYRAVRVYISGLIYVEFYTNNTDTPVSINLKGNGVVDWVWTGTTSGTVGVTGSTTLTSSLTGLTFNAHSGDYTLTISNPSVVTYIEKTGGTYSNNYLRGCVIPASADNITYIDLGNHVGDNTQGNMNEFIIKPEWTNLEYLDISQNYLLYIRIPSELVNLKTLKLNNSHNLGTHDKTIVIPSELSSLEYLSLTDNYYIDNIEISSNLTNLKHLILRSMNSLSKLTIPNNLSNLETLDLYSDYSLLKFNLPSGLTSNLHTLNLCNLRLTSIDIYSAIDNLTYLNLNNNKLTEVNTYSSWTGLTYLDLGQNKITSVDIYSTWPSLTYLDLSYNKLTSVDTYSNWTNLTTLNLYLNQITAVNTYSSWSKLEYLSIACNSITSIDTFAEWDRLISLELYQNEITSVDTFAEWGNIQEINLHDNNISTFTAYSDWTGMTYIDLSKNDISSVTDINNILIELYDSNLPTHSYVYLHGGTNAVPDGDGLIAKNNMLNSNVTVTTNTTESTIQMVTPGDTTLYFNMQGNNAFTIDYGDGSPVKNIDMYYSGYYYNEHVYTGGPYTITINGAQCFDYYYAQGELTTCDIDSNAVRLNYLNIASNQLTEFTVYPEWKDLQSLYLYSNQITSVDIPYGLNKLQQLNVQQNLLTSLTIASGLTNLQTLTASYNELTSFTVPSGLTNFYEMNLRYNSSLSDVDLDYLVGSNIRNLYIDHCALSSISFPNGLTTLQRLELNNNELTTFVVPSGSTNLYYMKVNNNQITSVDILGLTRFYGLEVYLNNNLLDENNINTLLYDLDNLVPNVHNSTFYLNGTGNVAPTVGPPDGITAKSNLLTAPHYCNIQTN